MRDKNKNKNKINVTCGINGITQSQPGNNDNDDNMMRVSVWFRFFGGLL